LRLTRALITPMMSVLVLTSSISDIREANYSTKGGEGLILVARVTMFRNMVTMVLNERVDSF